MIGEGITPSVQISSVDYDYTDSLGWGDLLTSYDDVTITYDAIGNPLSYYNGSSYTFTWKNGRQLATASVNGNTLSFNYNDEGIRTSKTVNEVVHTYHLSGSDIIAEEWDNNLVVYLYDADGSPLGMQYRTSTMAKGLFYTFWFEKNLQGDIVAVYNSAGTKLISYTYDAWGNCTTTNHNISGTNSYATYNSFSYRGYYFDSELGFHYLNSRYYDPAVGRFINADTLVSTGQGILGYNMFAYCNNEPVSHKDSLGTEAEGNINSDSLDTPFDDHGKAPNGQNGGSSQGPKTPNVKANNTPVDKQPNQVHGNNKLSTKPQHAYDIIDTTTGKPVKTGISGRPLNQNGTSPRANAQVNSWNRAEGYNRYIANIYESNIPGRYRALCIEKDHADALRGSGIILHKHKYP